MKKKIFLIIISIICNLKPSVTAEAKMNSIISFTTPLIAKLLSQLSLDLVVQACSTVYKFNTTCDLELNKLPNMKKAIERDLKKINELLNKMPDVSEMDFNVAEKYFTTFFERMQKAKSRIDRCMLLKLEASQYSGNIEGCEEKIDELEIECEKLKTAISIFHTNLQLLKQSKSLS